MNASPDGCAEEVLTVERPLEVCPELCPDAVDTEVNPEGVSDENARAEVIPELCCVEVVLEENIIVDSTEV